MIKSVYGIGTENGVLLPFSRTQESESGFDRADADGASGVRPARSSPVLGAIQHENTPISRNSCRPIPRMRRG